MDPYDLPAQPFLSTKEVRKALKISDNSLRFYVRKGYLPRPIKIGLLLRWPTRALRERLMNPLPPRQGRGRKRKIP